MRPRNGELGQLYREWYTAADVARIAGLLEARGTLGFPALPNGLFPAAPAATVAPHTGYQAVWVRDNVHIAHSLLVNGEPDRAAACMRALADHFVGQSARFEAIIAEPGKKEDPAERPHVKFGGEPAAEIPNWPHDQNDALGYFVWLYSRMAKLGWLEVTEEHAAVLAQFVAYFHAIRFWEDEDSGHWEEGRRNSASSVGAVCAGLRELRGLLNSARGTKPRARIPREQVEGLLGTGLEQLGRILPAESIQWEPQGRRYDAALLFLVYPLEIVEADMAERIVDDVRDKLLGENGIRRYIGDSFWCTDYRSKVGAEERTGYFAGNLAKRDQLLKPGEEAQWCIFDPILSVVFGQRYEGTGEEQWLGLEMEHFNRTLNQLTEKLECAELWHWETQGGERVLETSEATPLLWTKANLWLALRQMERSLGER